MPKYIEADALINAINDADIIADTAKFIGDFPVADVVEVVRCKDCRHKYYDSDQIICQKLYCCDGDNFVPSEDDFCSKGERGEE